jgi:hypothetical protein
MLCVPATSLMCKCVCITSRVLLLQLLQQHCILLILSLLKWGHNSVFLFFCATCQCQNGFMVILCHQKNKIFLSDFTQTRIILIDFHYSVKYKISQKSIRCIVELMHVDRRTLTDLTNWVGSFCKYMIMPKVGGSMLLCMSLWCGT